MKNLALGLGVLVATSIALSCQPLRPPAPVRIHAGLTSSVEPLADAHRVLPRVADAIRNACHTIVIAMWGLDEEMRLSSQSARASGTRDVDCTEPDDRILTLLRCQATRMAEYGNVDIRVMVWSNFFDTSIYAPPVTDAGDLGVVNLPWDAAMKSSDDEFIRQLRQRGCGERRHTLLALRNRYRQLRAELPELPFPSGILVVAPPNLNGLTATHHMKVLLTENEAVVGGINLLKENWDTDAHLVTSQERASSGDQEVFQLAPWFIRPFRAPIHDTAAVVRGAALLPLAASLEQRWADVDNFSVRLTTVHPRGPLLTRLRSLRAGVWGADAAVLDAVIEEVSQLLPPIAAIPNEVVSQADPEHLADVDVAVSLPARASDLASGQQVRAAYEREAQALGPRGAFYVENQYFMDVPLAQSLLGPHAAQRRGIVVIPYQPDVLRHALLDGGVPWLGIPGATHDVLRSEMRTLKWLELRTAEDIRIRRETGQWDVVGLLAHNPACDRTPAHLRFAAEDDPASLQPDDSVDARVWRVVEGVPVTAPATCGPGCVRQCPVMDVLSGLRVRDVMTRSRISAYALLADDAQPSAAGTAEERLHDVLREGSIYVHGKTAAFFRDDGTRSATLGSANLNTRSLGSPVRGFFGTDDEDTELNVFWRSPAIAAWWNGLWNEHMRSPLPADVVSQLRLWDDASWRALAAIRAGNVVRGGSRVVRLDVVDRCFRQGACR